MNSDNKEHRTKNALHDIGFFLFNNPTPSNLLHLQDNPFPKYLTLRCRIQKAFSISGTITNEGARA